MIYGYEQPVQYNPVEVFNPVTANMVLQSMGQYADVLQREHERALQEEKEFLKDYGDFSSPVNGATEAYYNLGVGNVKKALDIAYANGVDLTRSQEGIAMLGRIINSAKVGKMNELKQQKEAAELYNKTMQTLVANGKLTPEQAARKMQWDGVNNFQALDENGNVKQYPIATISPFEDTNQFVDRIFGDIKDTYIEQDGSFDVNGVGMEKLKQALGNNIQEYLASDGGRYAFEQFMKNNGMDMSKLSKEEYDAVMQNKDLREEFGNQILDQAAGKYKREARKLNQLEEKRIDFQNAVALDTVRTKNDIYAANQKELNSIRNEVTRAKMLANLPYYTTHNGKYKGPIEDVKYDHLTQLTNAGSEEIENQANNRKVQSGVVVGVGGDGKSKKTAIIYDSSSKREIVVIEDPNGNIVGKKKDKDGKPIKYRKLDEREQQQYVLSQYGSPKSAYRAFRIKDQYGTLNDYLKSGINDEGALPSPHGMKDDLYTIDGIMARTYGSGYKGQLPGLQKTSVNIDGKDVNIDNAYIEYAGYSLSPIMNRSNGQIKSQFAVVNVYDKNQDGSKTGSPVQMLYKIGEYKLDNEGYWVPTGKWAPRMISGNVSATKGVGDVSTIE